MNPLALLAPIKLIVETLKPVLIFFHDSIGLGWGMSIVLLTICIRGLLSPLMVKQFKSMKAMVAYAPEIKAVQEKYKDDKERQRQEVMKVYQANKINPFASCLPIAAQFPFFIGLYYLLRSDLRHEICGVGTVASKIPCGQIPHPTGAEKFLFIPDLTDKATGVVLVVLIVLYIGSQLLSSILTPSTGDRNQKMLMYGLPFLFTFFIIRFPAGLIVYWITTNLWTVTQGYVLRKRLGPIRPPDKDKDAAVASRPAPDEDPGARKGLLARLMEGAAKPAAAGVNTKQPVTAGADQPVAAGAKGGSRATKSSPPAARPARNGPPPPSPRKKKKRSGRRR